MEPKHRLQLLELNLPESFFEKIIGDIPASDWISFFQMEPILKETVFEGFSGHPSRFSSTFPRRQLQLRLRKLLRAQAVVLDKVLRLWGDAQLSSVAFVEMFDQIIVLENWKSFKCLLGPERFLASLHLLGYLEQADFRTLLDNAFWDRQPDPDVVEFLIPVWNTWRSFVQEYPQATNWIEGIQSLTGRHPQSPAEQIVTAVPHDQSLKAEQKRRLKLEEKLQKSKAEQQHLHQQLTRGKQEAETLRRQISEWESSFEKRLRDAVDEQRRQWFSRYRTFDEHSVEAFEESRDRMDGLLARAIHAFELQRQADLEYGLVAEVRQKLLQVELYLKEVERIYADSMVVHSEVAKVKQALQAEHERILQLPGINRVLQFVRQTVSASDLGQRIHLIEAVPTNLQKIKQVKEILDQLAAMGLVDGLQELQNDIEHKRRQIMEILYARFKPPERIKIHNQHFQSFEEFVQSGESKRYDLYLDGYNILLRAHHDTSGGSGSLSELRESFIDAVARKSHLFRRVHLIFDGLDESRDRRENLDIIYSNKARGNTADSIIIDALNRRKDKFAILVTEDNEIIDAVEKKIYAIVGAYHFYIFISDLDYPLLP